MIITRTPFRISLFGGGTDYPLWSRQHGGAVLATTIDKYCYITCRYLPPFFEHRHRIVYSKIENVRDIEEIQHPAVNAVMKRMGCERGLEIHHDGDLPARTGLGSSSSFTVGLIHAINALNGRYVSKRELAQEAIYIEQELIGENVGSQDQICAAFGGFNRIALLPNGTFEVDPLILPKDRFDALQSHLMLAFTGISRFATEIAKSQMANFDARQGELTRMREMVDQAIETLRDPRTPISEIGQLLHEGWTLKRRLSDKVSTPHVDQLYEAARLRGAIGGKLLGAGGGGFLLLFVPPQAQPSVRRELSSLVHVPFNFENEGSRVVLYEPNGL